MNDEGQIRYWMQVFNVNTWRVFLESGGCVTGFRETRWNYIQRTIRPGDRFLCYLSGVSKWVGVLNVLSEPYLDTSRIWQEELFPCRVAVSVMARLPVEKALPILDFKERLSIFETRNWSMHFITSPAKWKNHDGEIVESAILNAAKGHE